LAVRAPVLSITSNADVDPTGLVGSSYLRSAPFNGMPAGDKYLLMLHDSAHTVLAGNNVSANTPNDLPEDMGDMPADRSSAGGGDPTSR
ncbi:hypothetical protein, partial [Streptococcus suis]|uniref:hypothetical protein n=1 Tax=Streptococcus suis TaxID=1307 RepID=UPI0029C3A027